MDWISKLKNGDFRAIPEALTWENGGRQIAMLVDGYDLARFSHFKSDGGKDLDGSDLAYLVCMNVRKLLEQGEDVAAIDLWVCMFFESRREHFMSPISGSPPQNDRLLDVMSEKLPQSLKVASEIDIGHLSKAIADFSSRLGPLRR